MAASPKPSPAPAPTPSPSASATTAPTPHRLPIVVIYPFDSSSDIKADVGQRAAQLFVQQIDAAGGVDAILGQTNVKHEEYLKNSRSLNADYYVSGYMTPLGNGVSLVEHIVSTQSGTIVYGYTAQIVSFEDASSQAANIHDGIVAREKSLADAYTSAQAESTATPAPKENQANLGKGISDFAGLFKHHGKAAPTPVAAAAKPAKGVLVVHANGALPANDLTSATTALYNAMNNHYNVRMSPATAQNLTKEADGICGSDRNNTIATGVASAKTLRHGLGSRTEWTFVLDVYTCFGAKLSEHNATASTLSDAVKATVTQYADAHPQNG